MGSKSNSVNERQDETGKSQGIRADNPIQDRDEDTLGRSSEARHFADHVLSLDSSDGLVVGVLGPWGSGKTSFINLARPEIQRAGIPILDFNPWMFSGTEQLVLSFFDQLAAQLKVYPKLKHLGKHLETYGDVLGAATVFVGLPAGPIRALLGGLGKGIRRKQEDVGETRRKVKTALENLDCPIVVILDDVDRLSTSEIKDVFKLVRLTANFPNLIYVMAFDRQRVEKALNDEAVSGRDYLEKILQTAVDIPVIPSEVLNREIFFAIDKVLRGLDSPGPFDEARWPDVFMEVIRPLIDNMRDVRRYTTAVYGTVRALEGEVALVDVLALEAIRVFEPDIFRSLSSSIDALTSTSSVGYGGQRDPDPVKEQVEALVNMEEDRTEVIDALISRIFPAASRHRRGGMHYGPEWKSRWLRERRVAHEDILRLYFERVTGSNLHTFKDAENAWCFLSDREALDDYLRSIEADRIQDVISALEEYEDEFSGQHVVSGAIVLLNLLPDLPDRKRSILDVDTELIVTRVVYRLVRSLEDASAVEDAVRMILPEVDTLSGKLDLINTVGYRENVGHKLVPEPVAATLEREWRDEVRNTPIEELDFAREYDLLRVYCLLQRDSGESEPEFEVPADRQVTLALLRSAKSYTISQTVGTRAVQRSPRLWWSGLVEVLGSEDVLRERIDTLKAADLANSEELIELAEKYLSGWRPSEYEE